MEREEKEAFWLVTIMLYENVSPKSIEYLDDESKRQLIYLVRLASNYMSEGRLIPKNILDFIKSKVIISDLRNYIQDLIKYKDSREEPKRIDITVINLLLKEIQEQESVDTDKEEKPLLKPSAIKYLEKLIYGTPKERTLLFEGCKECQN